VVNFLELFWSRLRGRETLRAHFWQTLANYTQQGFGLLFGVLLARLLTPGDFGAYGFAVATVFLAILPAMWSLAPTLVADAGRTTNLHHVTASFAWSIAAVRFAIVSLVVIWFGATGRYTTGWLCLIVGFTESLRELNNVQKAFLEGAGKFEPNFVSAMANMLFCIVVVIPIALAHRGPYVLVLPSLGMLIADFMIYRYFAGRSVLVRPRWIIPREFFHSGFWLWLNTIAEVGFSRFDKWFVGDFRGEIALGHYNRAFGYAPLSHMVLNSFLSNPTVVGFARCGTGAGRLRLLRRTAVVLFAGSTINWVVFFFFSRPIVLFLFGPQWKDSVPIFQAFASLSLAYAIAYLPIAAMYAQKRFREVAITRVCLLFAFVVILVTFRARLSPIMVAWLLQAMFVAQGFVLLFLTRSFFRQQSNGSFHA
jgi:O-antigen/teichoic acid export membrane protein